MRIRLLPIMTALAVGVALGVTAPGATAATLYTNGTHSSLVTVGTTASLTTNHTSVVLTSATSALNTCDSATLNLSLDQNSGGTVVGTITSGVFPGCVPLTMTGIFTTPWKLTISGSATTVGGITSWAATVNSVAFTLHGAGNYSGNLTSGVTAQQNGLSGAVCLRLNDAGTLSGPLTTNGRLDVSDFCFEGSAASYSLG